MAQTDKGKYIDPKKQFSKWLAKFGSYAWGFSLAALIGALIARPEASMACVYMLMITTVNKIIDTLCYTDNSKTEKILLTMLDKTKIELSFKGMAQSIAQAFRKGEKTNEEGDLTAEEEDGEGGNG